MEKKAFQLVFLGYITLALVGAVLLLLPISRNGPITFIDALFTSTSALCVTGLIVKDTPVFFTLFGKIVILTLIQLGGIGYMTLVGIFLHRLIRSLMLPELVSQSFPELKPGLAFSFARRVVLYTLIIETFGVFFLFLAFSRHYTASLAFKHAVFQSVSAFCNAGFSTFSTSLMEFRGDSWVNLIIITLIVTGGLGFFTVIEVGSFLRRKLTGSKQVLRLSTHSKSVLTWTTILIIAGALLIFLFEYKGYYKDVPFHEKVLFSVFQSVTPRTCGFNTVDFAVLKPATLYLIMLLMFIGGSPGGTAGGVKTNTFFLVLIWVFHYLKGYKNVYLFKRKIPENTIEKAILILLLSLTFLFLAIFVIFIFDGEVLKLHSPFEVIFEVISAFGTVGLSTGSKLAPNVSLSYDFNVLSKSIIIFTMLVGKIGILSLATYMIEKSKIEIGYPEDRYIVG